ncbi:MAG TPA: hypothetical protein VEQ59_23270, partial [Polyangiaceae bacterium]|nr:hypothetical protein [Polyangiaceae bacterium]
MGLACGEAPDSPSAAGVQRASLEVASLLELTLPDARTNDFFGKAVALDGDQALVGVIGRDSAADAGDDVGSAQLFERAGTTWKATDELFPSERVPQAQLGWAVAIRGETAALASATATAPAADTGDPDVGYAGLVYGFRKVAGRWAPQRLELDASALVEDRLFGYALAALDDEIFVGSPSSGQPGSVNVYHWQNGAFELKQALERPASAEVADDGFGWSLAATDDTVLVGAAGNPGAAGFVYVYSRDKAGAWQLEQTLRQKRHEETVGDYFGVTVSVEGDIALVGAAGNSDNNVAGGVYIFERADGKWGEDFTHELLPPTPSSFADGLATAIGPERIWIGSLGMPNGAGAVQPVSLRNREWQLDDQINPPTPDVEGFGLALAASGRSVLIGSDGDARHEGAVYVATELDGASCETDSDCSSGHCADGVCCDSACDSACFSCRASDKDEGPDGECGPVSNAVEPAEGDCATESAETCGQTGRCDGHGECALYKKGTACAAARCT